MINSLSRIRTTTLKCHEEYPKILFLSLLVQILMYRWHIALDTCDKKHVLTSWRLISLNTSLIKEEVTKMEWKNINYYEKFWHKEAVFPQTITSCPWMAAHFSFCAIKSPLHWICTPAVLHILRNTSQCATQNNSYQLKPTHLQKAGV